MPTALTTSTFLELAEPVGAPCVSVYMPTSRAGEDTRQGPIRFKNLLREAEEQLQARGLRTRELESFLEPARQLLAESPFWWHQSDGLAVFLSPSGLRSLRLPWRFEERVVVGDRFHVKPLVRLLGYNGHFYVLALSLSGVRLLDGSMFGVTELQVPDVPTTLAEALGPQVVERQLQTHTVARGGVGSSTALFHGHGEDADREKKEALAFFRRIDQGVVDLLGRGGAPLVLAGVDYLTALYRTVNHYAALLEDTIGGSPEDAGARDLRDSAWEVVRRHFEQAEEQTLSQYASLAGTRRAASTLEAVVSAAMEARVSRLLVSEGASAWGQWDAERHEVVLDEEGARGGEDLVDRASCETLRTGGEVVVLDPSRMPVDGPLAAVLRDA